MIKPIFHSYDILVIGAGGAGLMASLSARNHGFSVATISKVHPTKSHTAAAQGGINAALGNIEHDDWRWHMYDTIKGSDWLADQDAVEYMCKNAPRIVLQLADLGVAFSRLPDGKIYQRLYGGQSTEFGQGKMAYRACAAADQTGNAIITTLYQKALESGTHFFNEFFVYELIFDSEKKCIGAAGWSISTGEIHIFIASQVIIATGGYSQIYRNTTAAKICTGDGNALSALSGIALQDMEFVQFHPTALPLKGILITEAARAEGGFLLNGLGERFMANYSPEFQDLACRDVVALAIATEISQGRGAGELKNHVWLSLKHLDRKTLTEKLPNLLEVTKQFANCDPMTSYIPVAPAAHYTMGGIPTNIYGEVMPGLMAIGEAACVSVHGANRLGCNSLLDILVFAESAINRCKEVIKPGAIKPKIQYRESPLDDLLQAKGDVEPEQMRMQLQDIMQEHVGMFRNQAILEQGLAKLLQLSQSKMNISDKSLIWNNQLLAALETKHLLVQAIITCYAALKRTESRGAHYRVDYPEHHDQAWLSHSLVKIDEHYNLTHTTKAVKSIDNPYTY